MQKFFLVLLILSVSLFARDYYSYNSYDNSYNYTQDYSNSPYKKYINNYDSYYEPQHYKKHHHNHDRIELKRRVSQVRLEKYFDIFKLYLKQEEANKLIWFASTRDFVSILSSSPYFSIDNLKFKDIKNFSDNIEKYTSQNLKELYYSKQNNIKKETIEIFPYSNYSTIYFKYEPTSIEINGSRQNVQIKYH